MTSFTFYCTYMQLKTEQSRGGGAEFDLVGLMGPSRGSKGILPQKVLKSCISDSLQMHFSAFQ